MIKLKNISLLALSLVASTHCALACDVDSTFVDSFSQLSLGSHRHVSQSPHKKSALQHDIPALQANKKEKDIFNKKMECLTLKFGIQQLQNKDVGKSMESFRKAIEIDGSPLAYLYLSHLENDKETCKRYAVIVAGAVKNEAIDAKTANTHTFYVRSLIRLINVKKSK